MKKCVRLFAAFAFLLACFAQPVGAAVPITPQPPANTSTPDIIATSIVAGTQLENIELFNQSDTPVNLSDWQISFTAKGAGTCATPQTVTSPITAGWILPKHYFTFVRSQGASSGCTKVMQIQIMHGGVVEQQITIAGTTTLAADKVYQHKQRTNSPSSARSASSIFETDYTKVAAADQTTLFSDPLYSPPATNSGLQVLEILPNARDCAPNESDSTCGDFVKVYNSTDMSINLAQYRLRVGHKGQSASSTNTFSWGQTLDPTTDELLLPARSYFTLTTRNDGQPLSITDSGDYVWLEDAYGISVYSPVISYPDASSTTKVGKSWAFDGLAWRWSSAPQPDQPNFFPPETASVSTVAPGSSLKPCASNQYRSPETNRCRNGATTASVLTPCKENQERSPETNRCRSTLAAATGPKPCDAGEERNPETNRCRKVAAATSGHIKGAADTNPAANPYTWVIAVAAVMALGYATYEWRQDIALGFTRLKGKLAAAAGKFKR